MVITDPRQPDNPIVFVNEAFQKLTGYHRDEIIGRNCRFLQGPLTDPDAVKIVREAIESASPVDVDLLNYRKDGSTFWNALYVSPVRNDDGTVRYFFASQMDVTGRVEAQATIAEQSANLEAEVARRTADLERALEAKTILLHEVDHRVNNNLTMIGSLIRLQARSVGDPVFRQRLESMLERVEALAMVHRQLYESSDLRAFDIGQFARSLLDDVIGSAGRDNITTRAECATLPVHPSKATPLGLVLSEVVTNALKHAFGNGRGGHITLVGKRQDQRGLLVVSDDGDAGSAAAAPPGFGRKIIERLSKQAGAEVRYIDLQPGTAVEISFALEPPE